MTLLAQMVKSENTVSYEEICVSTRVMYECKHEKWFIDVEGQTWRTLLHFRWLLATFTLLVRLYVHRACNGRLSSQVWGSQLPVTIIMTYLSTFCSSHKQVNRCPLFAVCGTTSHNLPRHGHHAGVWSRLSSGNYQLLFRMPSELSTLSTAITAVTIVCSCRNYTLSVSN